MSNEPLFEVRGVTRFFEDGHVAAVRDATLAVEKGEFVIIAGPSGSGKSTLLHLMGGLDSPSGGEILFNGEPVRQVMRRRLFRLNSVGFVFQAFYLWQSLSASENVSLPLMESGLCRAERSRRIEAMIELVGLEHKLHAPVANLSFGERQRVAIARALVMHPLVVLADEPTGNLDTGNSRSILELFKKINRERRVTIIMVTHDTAAYGFADRVVQLLDGSVKEESGKQRPS